MTKKFHFYNLFDNLFLCKNISFLVLQPPIFILCYTSVNAHLFLLYFILCMQYYYEHYNLPVYYAFFWVACWTLMKDWEVFADDLSVFLCSHKEKLCMSTLLK
ncbi:hypothetical protein ACKWTF_000597 [Chironomus riparius]